MRLTISFEYDTETRVRRVLSSQPRPPFGLGELVSVLHDSHDAESAKKELWRAVNSAIKGDLPAITEAHA